MGPIKEMLYFIRCINRNCGKSPVCSRLNLGLGGKNHTLVAANSRPLEKLGYILARTNGAPAFDQ